MKIQPVPLNSSFVSNIHDLYGKGGDAWLKNLPDTLNQLSTLWQFSFLNPIPDLSYNFVGLVKMKATGKAAILKMAPKGMESLVTEMRWLKHIGKGVPEIYEFDEMHNAYLMEHLDPGHSLKSLVRAGNDNEATRIICQTIRSIQSPPPGELNFPHLSEFSKAFPLLAGKFDARLLSKAQSLFNDLTLDRTGDVLLHGDLHHDNILASDAGWKAIDPHGYVGDPVAEGGAMIRNALDCLPHSHSIPNSVERRLKIMADELPFDAQRIKAWAFCATALSAAWSVEDHGSAPELVLQVAAAIDQAKVR
ncbi:MAG: strB [Alphaproteobacteria bacterium]|jgi:streptomycin 6-kinase|nr:strB [Alphaproteobacteria bacterium]